MPYCRACGNRRSFVAGSVFPAAPTANGLPSGLMATFSPQGELATVTRLGADGKTAQAARENPREYFDTCLVCGSSDISWEA